MSIKNIDLNNLKQEQGFKITGNNATDLTGASVGGGFDINKDGIADIVIGAPGASFMDRNSSGSSYVIYGKKGGYSTIDLKEFNFTTGFKIIGATSGDMSGQAVSNAWDFNYDGVDDVLIGASQASPFGRSYSGVSYIVYGVRGGYQSDIDLKYISYDNNIRGFIILGASNFDTVGYSVSGGFNIKNDPAPDIIISAPHNSYFDQRQHAGTSYVIYGGANYSDIDLSSTFDTRYGFVIVGENASDLSGSSASGLKDINNDGIDDVVVSAAKVTALNRNEAGITYVVYGTTRGYSGIDLSDLKNYTQCLDAKSVSCYGFRILGENSFDLSGSSLSGSFDFNADGINDILIGSPGSSPFNRSQSGVSYIIYGKKGWHVSDVDLRNITQDQGFKIFGEESSSNSGYSVALAGDINNDGIKDIIIGSNNTAYIIFAKSGGYQSIDLADDLTKDFRGFKIYGASNGITVSTAGDFNADGIDDMIIGVPNSSTLERSQAGAAYVIYGFSIPGPPTPPSPNYIKEYVIPIAAGVAGAIVIGVAVFFGRKKYIEHQRGPLLLSSKVSNVYSLQDQASKHFSGAEKEPLSFNLIDQKKLEMVLSNGVLKTLGEHTYTNPSIAKFVSNIYESLAYDKHMQQFLDLVGDIVKGDSASEIIFDQPSSGYFNHTIAIKTDLSSASATKAVLMHELAHMLFERIANDLSQEASKAFELAYEDSLRLMGRYESELRSDNLKTPQKEYFLERMADYMIGLDNGRYSSGVKGYDELLARCVEMKAMNFTDVELVAFCGPIEEAFESYIKPILNDNNLLDGWV